jgi:uncharacterized protein
MLVRNTTRDTILCQQCDVADNFFSRMKGLLFTSELLPGRGLLLRPCSSIHMVGMQYALDAVFVDKALNVVGLVVDIGPGKFSPCYWKAHSCLELPVGVIAQTGTELGDKLSIE